MTLGFTRPTNRAPASAPPHSLQCRSDQHLLDGVGGGSQPSLKELFRRHGAAVHRLVDVLSTDTAQADRVVEDVFVTLWHRRGRLEDEVTNVRLDCWRWPGAGRSRRPLQVARLPQKAMRSLASGACRPRTARRWHSPCSAWPPSPTSAASYSRIGALSGPASVPVCVLLGRQRRDCRLR